MKESDGRHDVAVEVRTEELAKESVERIGADAPAASFVVRVASIFAGWTALHLTVLGLLLAPIVPGGAWTFVALFVLLMGAMATVLAGFREGVYPGAFVRLFVYRPFWYAEVSLFFLSLVGVAGFLVGLPFGHGVAAARWALAGEATLLALVFVVGYFGSRALVVRRLTFAYPDLPRAFDGVTIAQLSDAHIGPHTSRRFLRRVARALRDAKPDIIAHTGDQVDDFDEDVRHFLAAFGDARAPLGVFAIPGNHDVYAGWDGVRAGLERGGIRVLANASERIERNGEAIWVVGTGDPAASQRFVAGSKDAAPDIPRALAGLPPDAFVVALAHNPALWPEIRARGVQLTLSGHTHHGQLSIPALRWCLASPFFEYSMGAYERTEPEPNLLGRPRSAEPAAGHDRSLGEGDAVAAGADAAEASVRAVGTKAEPESRPNAERTARLYVHPGTGYWALAMRIGAWPELTLITLRRAGASPPAP
ncbi:MAG: metallophosphoesterase [Thermoplasmatota archaeon]